MARVHHNRNLIDGSKLYEACRTQPELGRIAVELPATPERKARRAIVAVRAGMVRLQRPKRNHACDASALPASLGLTLVEACEVDPPAEVEAVHWRLLSTHPATTPRPQRWPKRGGSSASIAAAGALRRCSG